jgi:hypothetical protein
MIVCANKYLWRVDYPEVGAFRLSVKVNDDADADAVAQWLDDTEVMMAREFPETYAIEQ